MNECVYCHRDIKYGKFCDDDCWRYNKTRLAMNYIDKTYISTPTYMSYETRKRLT